jgi:TatA/E family protein of Tat protein translocase
VTPNHAHFSPCFLGRRVAGGRRSQYDEAMNLGFPEMIFLFFLALIIFGPKKMPEIGRQIGRALNEFKRASNEFKSQIESEIDQIDREELRRSIMAPLDAPSGTIASGTLVDETGKPFDHALAPDQVVAPEHLLVPETVPTLDHQITPKGPDA